MNQGKACVIVAGHASCKPSREDKLGSKMFWFKVSGKAGYWQVEIQESCSLPVVFRMGSRGLW